MRRKLKSGLEINKLDNSITGTMNYYNIFMNYRRLAFMSCAMFLIMTSGIFAQDGIEKEVIVVRTFEPTVADAPKINLLPSLTDTISVKPVFSYNILPIPLASDFDVEPITPARMSGETVSKLYGSYLKLGVGSYVTPYAELSVNSLRHNKYSGGFYVKHLSSQGNVRLENQEKAFSQFADNEMLFYGKRMGRSSTLSANTGIKSNGFHYYGYDTALDTIPEKEDIRQRFMNANAGLRLQSTHADSIYLNYDMSLDYNYFQDRRFVVEHGFGFSSSFNKFFRNQVIGADIGVDYFDNTYFRDTSNLVLKMSPWFNKADEEWEVFAGFHAYYDQLGEENRLYFHPRASLQFSIIRNYVIPYVGIDGGLMMNNYSRLASENPFIVPGLYVHNANNSMKLYTGVKGNFTRDVSFNFGVSYSVIDDMHFYVVDDSPGAIGNQFSVVYDNIELLNYSGEIGADISNSLGFLLRVNYNNYAMKLQEHPWHKPALDVKFSANYNLGDKILLNTDVFYTGNRFARLADDQSEISELPGFADINIGLEYRYNRILSGFLRLNNISNSKYHKWNNYPVQGISVMAGFTYSL
ncbi:MAG: hypothetical protein ACFCUM_11040 [Bacteroidales bacterium]